MLLGSWHGQACNRQAILGRALQVFREFDVHLGTVLGIPVINSAEQLGHLISGWSAPRRPLARCDVRTKKKKKKKTTRGRNVGMLLAGVSPGHGFRIVVVFCTPHRQQPDALAFIALRSRGRQHVFPKKWLKGKKQTRKRGHESNQ